MKLFCMGFEVLNENVSGKLEKIKIKIACTYRIQ